MAPGRVLTFVVALIVLLTPIFAIPIYGPVTSAFAGNENERNLTSNSASKLSPRQCIWNPATQDFDCDEWLPTLDEFTNRMQDTSDQGRAIPENHGFFYSNLIDPTVKPEDFQDELYEMWYFIEQWAKNHNIGDKYYGASAPDHYALNTQWAGKQKKYVLDNKAFFNTKYTEAGKPVSEMRAEFLFDACYSQALAFACTNEDVYFLTRNDQQVPVNSMWNVAEKWVLTRANGPVQRIWQVDPRPALFGGKPCENATLIWDRSVNQPIVGTWLCDLPAAPTP